ncbi:MAG: hypothetical protein QOF59_2000 [Actinomycetota bacterium]|nr:hypothetical protein [Actinomycetota bacterium]
MQVVRGRYGWALLLLVIVSWDLAAALTNGETLTFTFRRAVSQTAWRWPVLVLIALLVVHLFLPDHIAEKYDPLDRLYNRIDPAVHTKKPPKRPATPTGPTSPQP